MVYSLFSHSSFHHFNSKDFERTSESSGLNPKAILKRGCTTAALKQTGALVKTVAAVQVGDTLVTELADANLVESKLTKK